MPVYSEVVSSSAVGSVSVTQGLQFQVNKSGINVVKKYVGEQNVPQDIKRRRRQVYDIMRHMGAPVLIKHMYNIDDVDAGIAKASPNYNPVYGQTRNEDPLSHGVGFCSIETSSDEWVSPEGELVAATTSPGTGYELAPRYRGFGPGILLWIIQPDAAQDLFRIDSTGALIKVQTATVQAPWYPEINDNDLVINVEVSGSGEIVRTLERYQAKTSSPVSMRGYGDRKGRREYSEDGGNRYVMNQALEMVALPSNNTLQAVETDR